VFFHGSRVENVMLYRWELVQSLRDHRQSLRTPRRVRAEEWNLCDSTVRIYSTTACRYVQYYVQEGPVIKKFSYFFPRV
jgi:hypothetical protein